jgi:tRNA pseudouridine38-40 synthase
MRFALVVAYLGGPFAGWQRQPGRPTVQGELESALRRMTGGTEATVAGAGRTDAGVHASFQVAHLDLPFAIAPEDLVRGLNGHLPAAIRVRAAHPAPPTFDARRSARAKLYVYRAHWGEPRLPWTELRSAVVRPLRDAASFAIALRALPGRRDMASFTVPDPETGSTWRRLFHCRATHHRTGLRLAFLGESFLRYQVRRMVGALLEVGWGRRTLEDFLGLLEAPRPGARVWTAPARGLTLERVYYRLPGLAAAAPGDEDVDLAP